MGTAPVLPTHGPFSHPIPVARATLLAFVSFARAVAALAYAAAQSPSPGAARTMGRSATREKAWKCILIFGVCNATRREVACMNEDGT